VSLVHLRAQVAFHILMQTGFVRNRLQNLFLNCFERAFIINSILTWESFCFAEPFSSLQNNRLAELPAGIGNMAGNKLCSSRPFL
jgi:hypothetical protein